MRAVSIVTPTLNSARTLPAYLDGIAAQDYPRELLEIVCADGGSSDGTRELLTDFSSRSGIRVELLDNPLVTAEAGKAVAVRRARGDLVALLDSDNVLPGPGWMRRMTAPFKDPEVFGAEPLEYTWRRTDNYVTRYCALLGMNDPLCLFLGNYDRLCQVTGRWTDLPVHGAFVLGGKTGPVVPAACLEGRGEFEYIRVELTADALPTIGANGTVLRRDILLAGLAGDYLFDIDLIHDLVAERPRPFAKVNLGVVHLFGKDLATFHRKQFRRIRDFLHFRRKTVRSYPWRQSTGPDVARFVLSCLTLLPLLWQAARGHARRPDPVWLLHPVFCWITLWAYGWGTVRGMLSRRTVDRVGWSQ